MIFYFSGTGNSEYVASKLSSDLGEDMVRITCTNVGEKYDIGNDERVGFVFPVYWYGLPKIVEEFVNSLHISNYKENYTYMVATYGASSGGTASDLKKRLKKKNITLDAVYGIKMVDNYILAYDAPDEAEQERIDREADVRLRLHTRSIINCEKRQDIDEGIMGLLSYPAHAFYKKKRFAAKFRVNSMCGGCGICAENCGCGVIEMIDNKPVWVKQDDCSLCLACIHRCPKEAIQYGTDTDKRKRYYKRNL